MNVDAYLHRTGVDPDTVTEPDFETLERLQRAHITSVPFENLAIVGDPHGTFEGDGVVLSVPHLYEKIVERGRGGFCFELNGLFCSLLVELGYDAERVAARVINDGDARPPANHHSITVQLDRRYVVDIGLGTPKMRRPVPIDGDLVECVDTEWRIVESDRPDEDYLVQARDPVDEEWDGRYLFTDEPRDLAYFRATCDFLQTSPESTFTGDPIVNIATETGYLKCSTDTFTRVGDDETIDRLLTEDEWYETLDEAFDLRLPVGDANGHSRS